MPYCPIKKRKTVYLDCLECEEKGCRAVKEKTADVPPKRNPEQKGKKCYEESS